MQMDHALEILQRIAATSPDGNGEITLTVSHDLMRALSATRQTTRIFQFFYLICGEPPPVNNVGYHERHRIPPSDGLKGAHALYRGLRRPFQDEGADGEVYIYAIKPAYTYKYFPGMVCVAKLVPAPENAVFLVFVRFTGNDFNNGIIIGWDWVPADRTNPKLPTDFNDRFDQEVWNHG